MYTLGELNISLGDDLAKSYLEESLALSTRLGDSYPDRPKYYKFAVYALRSLAKWAMLHHQLENAQKLCLDAERMLDENYSKSEEANEILFLRIQNQRQLAEIVAEIEPLKSIPFYQRLIASFLQFEKVEKTYEEFRYDRIRTYLTMADIYLLAEDFGAAQTWLATARSTLEDARDKPINAAFHNELEYELNRLEENADCMLAASSTRRSVVATRMLEP